MNQIHESLKKIGLKNMEIKTYIALLELKEAQTGLICKKTNIASSNIYQIIESLIKKGLVSYKLKNNIKIFMPSNPESLNQIFKEKQEELEKEKERIQKAISNLKKIELEKNAVEDYKYFEGYAGIKSMLIEVINNLEENETYKSHFAEKENYKRLLSFWDELSEQVIIKKIKTKLIIPINDKKRGQELKKRFKSLTQIKYKKIKNEANFTVTNNMLITYSIKAKPPKAFLIKDKTFAKSFESLFDDIWENT